MVEECIEDTEAKAKPKSSKREKVENVDKDEEAEGKAKSSKRKMVENEKDEEAEDKPESIKRKKLENADKDEEAEDKPESVKRKKIEDRDTDMDSEEKEPKKLKLSMRDGAAIEIAVSNIKDKYKDATLLPKWRAFHTIIFLEKDEGLKDSSKIAAFDFNGCLANTNVFIACGFDQKNKVDAYRKPKPGMWRIMEKYFNSGIAIDMNHSFYVGDAAGREQDHSDADIKFAEAIGLKFYLPEEFCDTED